MFGFLKSLFWTDEARRNETEQQKQARKLEMDEPMAGAGTLLDNEHVKSETEENLKRDAEKRGS